MDSHGQQLWWGKKWTLTLILFLILFRLLFLVTSGPSLNNLVFTAMYATYMLIGGYCEEVRLIRIFGEDYLAYRSRVGAYFPRLRRRRPA